MNDVPKIRREPGTYALILRAEEEETIQVGSLGLLRVRPGVYAYVGSAFGPGGVRARVQRHARDDGGRHWHVDYLRTFTVLESVWFTHDESRRECNWARTLRTASGATVPLEGFGSSDCECPSHLVVMPASFTFSDFRDRIRSQYPGHAEVHRSPTEALRHT